MPDDAPILNRERQAALTLASSADYRVLRRITPREFYGDAAGRKLFSGLAVDTESTGLDRQSDLITEYAGIPFTYTEDGEVIQVMRKEIYSGFQDPCIPLSWEVTAVSGHTNESLKGKHLDIARIEQQIAKADLIIAHNAAHDRALLERLSPSFKGKVFGCSMTQINWLAEGITSSKQEMIAMNQGLFYEAHRAEADALALLHLLAMPLPKSEAMPLAEIRKSLSMPRYSIHIGDTPFGIKNDLYRMGYRWRDGSDGSPKGYRKTATEQEVEAVVAGLLELLRQARCKSEPEIKEIPVQDLFSVRQ